MVVVVVGPVVGRPRRAESVADAVLGADPAHGGSSLDQRPLAVRARVARGNAPEVEVGGGVVVDLGRVEAAGVAIRGNGGRSLINFVGKYSSFKVLRYQ